MKKSILKVGKALSKQELQTINGGFACYCNGSYVGETNSLQACWDACPSPVRIV